MTINAVEPRSWALCHSRLQKYAMRRLHCRRGVLLGLLVLPALWGCRAIPVQVIKPEGEVDLQRYATLVVKDFRNSIGDALPPGLLQELPESVMTHLNACYPSARLRGRLPVPLRS